MVKVFNRKRSVKYLKWFRYVCIFNSIEECIQDKNWWRKKLK